MDDKTKKVDEQYKPTPEELAEIEAIINEETNAKVDDIIAYIESGDLDKDLAQAKEQETPLI